MAFTAKPEVLSPRLKRGSKAFDDENLDLLSHVLDDWFPIPGTSIRFGLDGIVGFVPGIGDLIGGIASCIIILAAWVRGVSYGDARADGGQRRHRGGGRLDSRCWAICSTSPGAPTGATTLCWTRSLDEPRKHTCKAGCSWRAVCLVLLR